MPSIAIEMYYNKIKISVAIAGIYENCSLFIVTGCTPSKIKCKIYICNGEKRSQQQPKLGVDAKGIPKCRI
jgi:hypothetical protein